MATHAQNFGKILLVAGFVAACIECPLAIVATLLIIGFAIWVIGSYLVSRDEEKHYWSMVEPFRTDENSKDWPTRGGIPTTAAIAAFVSVVALCVFLESPIWGIAAGMILFAVGIQRQWAWLRTRDRIWSAFAWEHEFQFTPGGWTVAPEIRGEFGGFEVTMTTVWRREASSGGTGWRRTEHFEVEVESKLDADSREGMTSPIRFGFVDLTDRLNAIGVQDLVRFDQSVFYRTQRVPQATMELRFHLDLLRRIMAILENRPPEKRLPRAHGADRLAALS